MLAYLLDICCKMASKSSDAFDGSDGAAGAFPFPFPFEWPALGVPVLSDGVAVARVEAGFFLLLD